MKEILTTRQFRKDFKKYQHDIKKVKALHEVIEKLRNEEGLPPKYRQHSLQGEYEGCLECHIGGDYLLIWVDEQNNTIKLTRLGTHSELFKK